ncbi:hypothetical protein CXG81DRAFT_26093 [Caulochytrium protostelioides]|nr:hypothetical protein CXG81DRAFT_26093 [Caulochytrium protostelioides]|eukprot:RKP01230.1 hypothetical protein CXG81DRAFT_26093 [Caulochytrium protostelioides]
MTWREREASLYALFERGFSASKVTLKIGASLTDFGVEVEVPNDQATKFEKYFKGQALPMEIDKMHGLHPVNKTRDVKLFGLKKSLGSTVPYTNRRSSLENLQERLASLESCGQTRDREVLAMQEQLNFLLNEVTKRTQGIEARVEERIADKVERRMAMMEKTIRDTALACIGV